MQQGRRTASLKASYDAVNLGLHAQEFSVGRELLANTELQAAAQQALAATAGTSSNVEQKRNKRYDAHAMPNIPIFKTTDSGRLKPLFCDLSQEIPTHDPSESGIAYATTSRRVGASV